MMMHVVLFTPRPTIRDDERERLARVLASALDGIPSVRRYHVGRRVTLGTAYDRAAPLDFSYLVAIEFDDRNGLVEYLGHPQHEALGQLFYSSSERACAYDFETVSSDVVAALTRWAGY
jgi:hypothetical protein